MRLDGRIEPGSYFIIEQDTHFGRRDSYSEIESLVGLYRNSRVELQSEGMLIGRYREMYPDTF